MGIQQGESGSLSHAESVDMSLISSCAYVSADSSMSVTEVQVATETNAQMARTPKMHYEINAGGIEGPGTLAVGTISAGMSAPVDDKRTSVTRFRDHCGWLIRVLQGDRFQTINQKFVYFIYNYKCQILFNR